MTNNFLPKLKKADGYARQLLVFLQQNPELKVAGVDFLKNRDFPFLGQMPSARLAELKEMGYVKIVGKRRGELSKTQPMNEYMITEEGLQFKI